MTLRGTKPTEKTDRLKLMMFSPAGIGKTTAAIDGLPKPYIIDTENGTSHYGKIIADAGGAVFETAEMSEALAEVLTLSKTPHEYLTVVIDSFTPLYEAKADEGASNPNIGDAYGKHTAYANRHAQRLFRALSQIDMNVVVTCHAKDLWDGGEKKGQQFDGWKKTNYIFDLVLELQRRGKERWAHVDKTRLDQFPDQESFLWSADELKARWGAEKLSKVAEPIVMATAAQADELSTKVRALNIPAAMTDKWLKKADAATYQEMTGAIMVACIEYCDSKLAEAKTAGSKK